MQTVKSQSVCRVMVIPRSSWEGLARSFGREARAVLCNLQSHVEQMSEMESERFCIPVSPLDGYVTLMVDEWNQQAASQTLLSRSQRLQVAPSLGQSRVMPGGL